MSDQKSSAPTFEISLCMAGAISAGAYTAGVVDFLIEALEEWEKKRPKPGEPNPEGIPDHRVVLRGFAGASAGGIVGALATVALSGNNIPSPEMPAVPAWVKVKRLYQAWVTGPDMVPTLATDNISERPGFFGLDDLKNVTSARQVASILNGAVLDGIRDRCFTELGPLTGKAYIAAEFHAYLTLSNLRGVPYQISFPANNQVYGMQDHGDRGHYLIRGLGTAATQPTMADYDAKTALSVTQLAQPWAFPYGEPLPLPESWYSFSQATLSTAAFPVGLPPRMLSVDLAGYDGRLFPSLTMTTRIGESRKLKPAWADAGFQPTGWNQTTPRPIVNVDGGMIDNDPFEYARMMLIQVEKDKDGNLVGKANPRGEKEATRAVIMVMPFPEPPAFLRKDADLSPTLLFSLSRLAGTLVNQARFKAEELIAAADETVFSRFLISPRRWTPEGVKTGGEAIASGLLGGFGGFALEAFRDHDYQLGRRNCQQFLREAFVLHKENNVVAGWVKNVEPTPQDERFSVPTGPQDHVTVRIIPLYGTAACPVPKPHWPQMTVQKVDELTNLLDARLQPLIPLFLREAADRLGCVGCLVKVLLRLPVVGRLITQSLAAAAAKKFRAALIDGLNDRDQAKGSFY